MNTSPLHVVLGAGQIGTLLAKSLRARGERVRQVRKGKVAASTAGHEWLSGDLSDPTFAARAMHGATAVYHCVNAPYHEWPKLLPSLQSGILAGARATSAKLVVLDNLYMYGRAGEPMRETTPVRPCSKKGELRARLADELLAAHGEGSVRVAIARASDFFGPEVTLAAVFGERFFTRVLQGKRGEGLGNPDMPHAYSYGPDVAEGLRVLGAAEDDAFGRVWHLPVAHQGTTRELADALSLALGGKAELGDVPPWLFRALGLFVPQMREVPEMLYQWERPFLLDDSAFRRRFSVSPTAVEIAVRETAAWARARFGAARAA
jgi:nucleoside-diphosphate-sugar epimerase